MLLGSQKTALGRSKHSCISASLEAHSADDDADEEHERRRHNSASNAIDASGSWRHDKGLAARISEPPPGAFFACWVSQPFTFTEAVRGKPGVHAGQSFFNEKNPTSMGLDPPSIPVTVRTGRPNVVSRYDQKRRER